MATGEAKITLYTYHGCPYAHRAHIALQELGLPFEEVLINIERPRDPWYMKINPRGLVPAMTYQHPNLGPDRHIFIESAIIVQFLCDTYPSHLLPASNTPRGALFRARLDFFVDTWNTKVGSFMFGIYRAGTDVEKEAIGREWVAAVRKEIEPLLADANPFLGGMSRLTIAEVLIAPFLLRIYACSEANILPTSVKNGLNTLPNFSKWAKAVMSQPSVLAIWDAEKVVALTAERIQKMKLAVANGAGNCGRSQFQHGKFVPHE